MNRRAPFLWRLALALGLALAPAVRADTPAEEVPAAPEEPAAPATRATPASAAERPAATVQRLPAPEGRPAVVYVVPVESEIGSTTLFILRRALKEAIEQQADLLLLQMDTPGGRLDITLEAMQMLDRFQGRTATFVESEAISAGAFIASATQDIYMAPSSVVGAAAPVMSGGQDIEATMRTKVLSFLKARVRALEAAGASRYRAQVVTAMMEQENAFEVEGIKFKDDGEILTLTARESVALFGDPAQPLFASGMAESLDDLLNQKFGEGNWEVRRFEMTWSVELAQFLTSSAVTSLLLGIGLLCLYLEFKTPGFGVFGAVGAVALAVVFLGHYVAGLSGYEAPLIFVLGALLIIIELVFFPGVFALAVPGVLLMLGALVWGMADIWPQSDGTGIVLDWNMFLRPIVNLAGGLVVSLIGLFIAWRFLPKTSYYSKLVLEGSSGVTVPASALDLSAGGPGATSSLVGRTGLAATDLRPTGIVVIEGRRYEATAPLAAISAGEPVRVTASETFNLRVERA
jgi:membrane-bound serine protease (ClpP class)